VVVSQLGDASAVHSRRTSARHRPATVDTHMCIGNKDVNIVSGFADFLLTRGDLGPVCLTGPGCRSREPILAGTIAEAR